jgi:KaiC/GvpD/RAD55 family RecA-like ATPase
MAKDPSAQDRVLAELQELRREVRTLRERVDDLSGRRPPSEGRIRTFVDGFDDALEGGIPAQHVVLIAGPSGTMKTSLALNMVHRNAQAGIKGLYVSLEESRESLLRTMERLGMAAEGDFIVDIARLRTEHEVVEEARDWLRILKDYLQRRVEKDGIELVVVDPLNGLYALAELENPRRDMFHLFNFLRGLRLTSVFVAEAEDPQAPFRHHEDFLADGAIALQYTNASSGRVELWMRCRKMRHANHSRDFFRLDHAGGRFVATPVPDQ